MGVGDGGRICGEIGGGEDGEEDEGGVVRVVGRVNRAGGDVSGITDGEVAVILIDPLFSLTGNDVDHFFAMRVGMERVAVMRRHRDANEEEFVGGDEVGTAEPFHVRPGIGFADGVGVLNKTLGRGHSLDFGIRIGGTERQGF